MQKQRCLRVVAISMSFALIVNIVGCGSGGVINPPKPDIVLSGDENRLAENIKGQYDLLNDLANNPGQTKTIQLGEDVDSELLTLSFVKNDAAGYEHPRFVRQKTGEIVNLVWGIKGIIPTIKGVDDSGSTLQMAGEMFEYQIEGSAKSRGTAELVAAGATVAAIAFAVWLGAGIAKAVFAAIGFVAFNAMVIGLLVASVAILTPIARVILDYLDINNLNDAKNIFQAATSDIVQLFKNTIAFLNNRG